jgi:uncharacterized protein YbaP (TraB family)
MKKIMPILTTVILLSVCSVSAQTNSSNSLLWEISGKGLKQPSYLFGTIHVICKEDFVLSESIQKKWENADQVFLELDMDDPKLQMELIKMMQLPKGSSLQSIFGKEGFDKLDQFFKDKMGMSAIAFNGYKPMMVMSLLYQKLLPCKEVASYETSFMDIAKKHKKDIQGLESVEAQMGVFDVIPDQKEAKSILDMIADNEKQNNELEKMIGLYKGKDVEALYRFTIESPSSLGDAELFLHGRNRSWIPVMDAALQKATCFFAVGAAHLGGEQGLIQLLLKAGYTVKPVLEL